MSKSIFPDVPIFLILHSLFSTLIDSRVVGEAASPVAGNQLLISGDRQLATSETRPSEALKLGAWLFHPRGCID